MLKEELSLPVANWQDKTLEERAQDLASAILEFQRKPNVYWTTLGQQVRLLDTNRKNNPVYQDETTATAETIQWAAFGNTECLAWISQQRSGFYKWSRIVVSNKYEDRGVVYIQSVAVCLPIDRKQCERVYAAFTGSQEILGGEDFNNRPVEFDLPLGKNFNDLVGVLTGKTIAQLVTDKLLALADGREIMQKRKREIELAQTPYEFVFVGAKIEQEVVARGHLINRFLRDCPGLSNTEALALFNAPRQIFADAVASIDQSKFTDRKTCGRCGKETYVWSKEKGGCDICMACNVLYNLGL